MEYMLYFTEEAEVALMSLPVAQRQKLYRRIAMMMVGHFPGVRPLGSGLLESRIHSGPGIRMYYAWYQGQIVILLVGTKHHQAADIDRAKKLFRNLKE